MAMYTLDSMNSSDFPFQRAWLCFGLIQS